MKNLPRPLLFEIFYYHPPLFCTAEVVCKQIRHKCTQDLSYFHTLIEETYNVDARTCDYAEAKALLKSSHIQTKMLYYFESYGENVTSYNIITQQKNTCIPAEFPDNQYCGAAAWTIYAGGVMLTGGLCNDSRNEHFQKYVKTAWKVDTDKWSYTLLADLNKERGGHAMITVNGSAFAIGGFDGQDLSQCEVFVGDLWLPIADLIVPTTKLGVVEHQGVIYAAGWPSQKIQKYDLMKDCWTTSVMNQSPFNPGHALVFMNYSNDKICIMRDDGNTLSLIIYDPESDESYVEEEFSHDSTILWSAQQPIRHDDKVYLFDWNSESFELASIDLKSLKFTTTKGFSSQDIE